MFNTFKTLSSIADFNGIENFSTEQPKPETNESVKKESPQRTLPNQNPFKETVKPDFHYNIQIHLPATTDISVYNAIFKSIKDNLM